MRQANEVAQTIAEVALLSASPAIYYNILVYTLSLSMKCYKHTPFKKTLNQ